MKTLVVIYYLILSYLGSPILREKHESCSSDYFQNSSIILDEATISNYNNQRVINRNFYSEIDTTHSPPQLFCREVGLDFIDISWVVDMEVESYNVYVNDIFITKQPNWDNDYYHDNASQNINYEFRIEAIFTDNCPPLSTIIVC